MPETLRAAGLDIRVHDELFPQATQDVVWLTEAGAQRWVAITALLQQAVALARNEPVLQSENYCNTASVLVSVLAESLALGAIGGTIGGVAAYLAFNGYRPRR